MIDCLQVQTTTPDRQLAERIAARLVEDRLAACVQVAGPIRSTYRWKGAVEAADEWLCLIKTSRALYGAVEAAIKAMHPYETPEIIATAIVAGSPGYVAWLTDAIDEGGQA